MTSDTSIALAASQQRVQELLRALEAARLERAAPAAGAAAAAATSPAPLVSVRGLTDKERLVLELRYTADGRPRRGCASVAARMRISQPRVIQLSTNATSKLVAMVRARRAGRSLPDHGEADLARFAGLTARWWSALPSHLAPVA
jgi:DNA-directed RNA polymerase sigma subunit (sigma70/sigma32)